MMRGVGGLNSTWDSVGGGTASRCNQSQDAKNRGKPVKETPELAAAALQ